MVDILMPTYKPNATYLKAALESVLAQSVEDWQLWICDEPTEVDTKTLLADFLEDPRIHYSRNEKRLGIGGNWNQCFKKSSAPFIQYMFQDDVWEPNYLESALKVLEQNPDVGFVSLGHRYVFEGEIPTKDLYDQKEKFLRENVKPGKHVGIDFLMWWMEHGLHPNVVGEPMFVMMRRELIQKVGPFNEQMPQQLDIDYWTRCLLESNWFNLAGDYGSFRVHGDSASMRNYMERKGLFDRYKVLKMVVRLVPKEYKNRATQLKRKHFKKMVMKLLKRLYSSY